MTCKTSKGTAAPVETLVFTVQLNVGEDTHMTGKGVADALRYIANRIEPHKLFSADECDRFNAYDRFGNPIGHWSLTEGDGNA